MVAVINPLLFGSLLTLIKTVILGVWMKPDMPDTDRIIVLCVAINLLS